MLCLYLNPFEPVYWNDHCTPGSEWLKFTKKCRPTDRLWTASDEEKLLPSLIALPRRENLGSGGTGIFSRISAGC
jgi:methionine sulfoxide reductase catalytic subunit